MKVTSVDLKGATEGTVIGIRKRSRIECDASACSAVVDSGTEDMKTASGLSRSMTGSYFKTSEWEPAQSDGGDDTTWSEYRYQVQYATKPKQTIIWQNRFDFELFLDDDCKVFKFQVSNVFIVNVFVPKCFQVEWYVQLLTIFSIVLCNGLVQMFCSDWYDGYA